ncbi:MAG: hypothetical protein A2Y57_01425 [Candidatus Woykebacteria bacterium RBG_13_40_7b]|uniref:Uncharacterized protein n=1 Tax=Candidatus Woykebacteria bacterium RBG_13_40_7b TaxID=1802594 RepID=A0A1G1W648_9BACT|nr:MAG: hypothetical protein A2Y57_01425 [Candidatus Woykebacteria bacterium RBG_13_40_7b]
MVNATDEIKDKEQIEVNKTSNALSIVRVVFAVSLLWQGASMVLAYQIATLWIPPRAGFTSLLQGQITQSQTLANWYSNLANSSAIINNIELYIWILVPSFLILISLILFRPKVWPKMVLIGLMLGVIIYSTAVISNKFNAERRKNHYSKSTQGPQRLFDSVKYPDVATYFYKDYNGFDDPSETSFTFSIDAEKEEVINFYLTKGFVPDADKPSYLFKSNVYITPGGQEISWDITITDEIESLNIKARTNDHWY